MGFTKLILKFAAPLPQIEHYNRYLFIGPHPDDIEIGAGATAAKLAAAGKEVCFLICTDGRFGDGNAPEVNTKLPLAQIAAHCGFTDESHLIRTFRKHAGKTPTAYRAEHKERWTK